MTKKPAPAVKKSRGRPAHVPTEELRERVAVLRGGGMEVRAIANAIGISHETLYVHYANELNAAADEKRGVVIEAMFKAAAGGNVSAQKGYLRLNEVAAAIPKAARRDPAMPKLGKKEQAQIEAQKALPDGDDWGGILQ